MMWSWTMIKWWWGNDCNIWLWNGVMLTEQVIKQVGQKIGKCLLVKAKFWSNKNMHIWWIEILGYISLDLWVVFLHWIPSKPNLALFISPNYLLNLLCLPTTTIWLLLLPLCSNHCLSVPTLSPFTKNSMESRLSNSFMHVVINTPIQTSLRDTQQAITLGVLVSHCSETQRDHLEFRVLLELESSLETSARGAQSQSELVSWVKHESKSWSLGWRKVSWLGEWEGAFRELREDFSEGCQRVGQLRGAQRSPEELCGAYFQHWTGTKMGAGQCILSRSLRSTDS